MLYGYIQLFLNIKSEDGFENIADDVEERFDTSNYEVNRPLSTGKNKKKNDWSNEV